MTNQLATSTAESCVCIGGTTTNGMESSNFYTKSCTQCDATTGDQIETYTTGCDRICETCTNPNAYSQGSSGPELDGTCQPFTHTDASGTITAMHRIIAAPTTTSGSFDFPSCHPPPSSPPSPSLPPSPPPASDSAPPTATIIGAAAGGAIGALLIVGVGVYLCMKSKKTVAPKA